MRARGTELQRRLSFTDVDEALARLEAVLRPRVGKRMTALCLKNLVDLKERGLDADAVLAAVHKSLDAYARIPESGTPFPLDVARAIGDAGCRKLAQVNLASPTALAPVVATHADALIPAYGEDDAEFAVRVAWKNAHHYFLNLVVGRAYERNDGAPTTILHEAWQAQGARGVPVGAVPVDFDCAGVLYATGVFEPDRGDPLDLTQVNALQRFFAKVPLRITPDTLAWLLHLVRTALPGVDVEGRLTVEWEPKEAQPGPGAGSLLMGIVPPPPEERASIRFVDGSGVVVARYAPGELSPV